MAKVTICTPDGDSTEFIHACGLTVTWSNTEHLPYGSNFNKHIQEIQELEIRDDDLYLATFPKCGTHWTWEIIIMLQSGRAEYETNTKESVFLDFKKASTIDAKPSPRVLNCHWPCRLTPRGIFERGTKIIHVMRNPKDAFVSMYYHHRASKSNEAYVKDFKTFLQYVRGDYGLSYYSPFFGYMKEWEYFTDEHPGQILNLFYEDLKEDPVREIQKINNFLGTNRDMELINQIAEACDFKKLKQADMEVKVQEHGDKDRKPFMYRKGEVGDWKNHFTVSMNEEMDKWIEEQSRGSNIMFRYTL